MTAAQVQMGADEVQGSEELIDVEVVDDTAEPGTSIVAADPEPPSALVAATDAALAMPGVAGRDEFLALAMQARVLSMSGAAPKAVRNNPYVALHVAMVGRDLGISPSAALELIDVIGEGDKTQLSLSPQLLAGQVRRLGLGSIERGPLTMTSCVAFAVEPGGRLDKRCQRLGEHWVSDDGYAECNCEGVLGYSEFTWEDAQIAGLVNKRCPSPTDHQCGSMNWKDQCRGGWLKYPRRMLWWRACGYCVDDYFPEAGLGLYTAEELGAEVDEDGRPIDPTTVPLPEGYEPEPAVIAAAPDLIDGLKRRIAGLTDESRELLRGQWKEADLPPVTHLSQRRFPDADQLVQALVIAEHKAASVVDADEVAEAFGAVVETPVGSVPVDATPEAVGSLPDDLLDAVKIVPVEILDRAIAGASLLPLKAVTSSLQMRGVDKPKGNLDAKRMYLAALMAVEEHAQATEALDGVDEAVAAAEQNARG